MHKKKNYIKKNVQIIKGDEVKILANQIWKKKIKKNKKNLDQPDRAC
jgi:hypothetical protein